MKIDYEYINLIKENIKHIMLKKKLTKIKQKYIIDILNINNNDLTINDIVNISKICNEKISNLVDIKNIGE